MTQINVAAPLGSFQRRRSKFRMARRETIVGYLFLLPWLIGFVVFVAGPTLASLALSLTKYDLLTPPSFIGLSNFTRMFTKDPTFYRSLERTSYFAALFVPLSLVGALVLAIYLNQRLRGTSAFRSMFFVPTLLPGAAVAVIWVWLLDPDHGVVNTALGDVGVRGPGWLTTTNWAVPGLVMISLWSAVGGNTMLIFLAALQGVPKELRESATLDGAGRWVQFRHVVFPAISPAVFFNLILAVIAAFKVFTLAYVATQGGPDYATFFYALDIYQQAFQNFQMGYASALAWILLVIVVVLTWLQFRFSSRWVHYGGEKG